MSGQGLLGPDSTGDTQRIHRENQTKLQGMSQSEILDEQKKLLSQLGSLFCFIYLCIMYIINYFNQLALPNFQSVDPWTHLKLSYHIDGIFNI